MAFNYKKNLFLNPIDKLINSNVPIVKKGQKISDIFLMLKKNGALFETVDYIYVTDKNDKLIGVFSIKDIFKFPKNITVEKFMQTKVISVSPNVDIELIPHLALKHTIKAIPVVKAGKLIGVISPKEVLQILNKSLREDIFHFAGIHKSHLTYENTLTVPLFKSVIHRIPWLIIGLIGIIFTAAFISVFEKVLEKYLILVFFIPAIVYVSGALGMQVQTLFIRDMVIIGKLNLKNYLFKQLSISLLMAFIISTILFASIFIFWKEPYLAFVISLSTFITLILTSLTAFLTVLILKKFGYDPALGGGPFATIISDSTSIMLYFAIVTLLL